jgi:hypothetical protein
VGGYKGEYDPGGMEREGDMQASVMQSVGDVADWTQSNRWSYGPGWNMPGVEGNTPKPGGGQFQTGSGSIRPGRVEGTA